MRLDDGDLLSIASSGAPQQEAFTAHARRWEIETLFGALKSRGFNFEDTHLTHPDRIGKLLALLALAFAWTYRTGQALAERQLVWSWLRGPSQAAISSRKESIIAMRRSKHWPASTANSHSALLSQRPCLGMWYNSSLRAIRRASCGGKPRTGRWGYGY